jgi:hypothetical protein
MNRFNGESLEFGCNVFEIATRRVVNGAWPSMEGCSEDTVLEPTRHQWKEAAQAAEGADLTYCYLSVCLIHPAIHRSAPPFSL